MRRLSPLFLFSGLFLLLFLAVGIKLGVRESQRRDKLAYKLKQGVARLQDRLGLS